MRQDLTYAVRGLARQPGFTATIVLVLAVAIGLNSTLFTVLAGVALRPWPGVTDPASLVRLYLVDQSGRAAGFSLVDAQAVAQRATTVSGVASMKQDSVHVDAGGATTTVTALTVSGNFFDVLGLSLAHGRGFAAEEDRAGAPAAVAVLAHEFWQRQFAGNPAVVGRTVRINDVPFTIVGVASSAFESSEPAYNVKVYVPVSALTLLKPGDPSALAFLSRQDACCADVVARLTPGVAGDQVRAELDIISRDLLAFSGVTPRGVVATGTEFLAQPGRGDSTQALVSATLLSVAMLLVWLIACANVGNLLLARAAGRVREIGIRLALGAGRGRVVRQLLTEGMVLSLAAGAAGIWIAYELPFVIFRIVSASAPTAYFPFSVTPDALVLGFALLLSAMSSVAFGLAPALFATRSDVAGVLHQRDSLLPGRFPLRGVLLAVQVTVSVILLVSAGLLIRGVQRQSGAFDPGFSVDRVTVVTFEVPERVYDRARATAFFSELADGLRELPIDASAVASVEPLSRFRSGTDFYLPGERPEQARTIFFQDVSPGYLEVLGIPLAAGRAFEPADADRPVVIINEAMARRYWPGENPLGKSLVLPSRRRGVETMTREIVGVAKDVRMGMGDTVSPMFYRPYAPGTDVAQFMTAGGRGSRPPVLLVKSPVELSDEVIRLAARLDPQVRVTTAPLQASVDAMLAEAKWGPIMAASLGTFALALATVGMFGVFAFAVRQRRREIGIRMALGASPSAVIKLVLAGHSRAVAVGLVVGLAGAVAASMILRHRLHGLSPFDPIAYASVGSLLALAAFAASYLPARRAAGVSPLDVLREAE